MRIKMQKGVLIEVQPFGADLPVNVRQHLQNHDHDASWYG